MMLQVNLSNLITAAVLIAAAPASAKVCDAAHLGPRTASLPEAWRRASEALIQASAIPGHPWGCSGGTVDLIAREDDGGMLLVVDADGQVVTRDVADPDEVVPLGEALLAKPLQKITPSDDARGARVISTAPPDAPRALLGALLAPRYAGRSNLVWGGVTLSAALPFGAWSAGAWGRYDGVSTSLNGRGPALREVCVGASASRSFALRSLELRASLIPSVAMLMQPTGPDQEETRISGRIGLEARGVVPFGTLFRGVVALDAELSPRELGEGNRPERAPVGFDGYPTYTIGVGLGVELAIR